MFGTWAEVNNNGAPDHSPGTVQRSKAYPRKQSNRDDRLGGPKMASALIFVIFYGLLPLLVTIATYAIIKKSYSGDKEQ